MQLLPCPDNPQSTKIYIAPGPTGAHRVSPGPNLGVNDFYLHQCTPNSATLIGPQIIADFSSIQSGFTFQDYNQFGFEL